MTKVSQYVTVFEFGYVGPANMIKLGRKPIATIPEVAFGYLEHLCLCADEQSKFMRLCSVDNNKVIKLRNYAGVLFTPDGTQIEILPKIGKKLSNKFASIFKRKTGPF